MFVSIRAPEYEGSKPAVESTVSVLVSGSKRTLPSPSTSVLFVPVICVPLTKTGYDSMNVALTVTSLSGITKEYWLPVCISSTGVSPAMTVIVSSE